MPNMFQRFQRALNDAPSRKPGIIYTPGPVPTPSQPPAVAMNKFRGREILAADFAAGETWRTNEWIKLSTFELPENTDWVIPAGEFYTLYVPAVSRFNGQNLGAPASATATVSNLIQTKLAGAWSGPAAYHPEVQVWATVSGSAVQCNVVSINYTTGVVTFTEPAGVATSGTPIRIYHMGKQGEFRIRLQRALGDKDVSIAGLVNNSLLAIHSIDQLDAREGLRWPLLTQMSQKQTLLIEVKSTVEHVWNAESAPITLVQLPAQVRDISVRNDQLLSAMRESNARAGI